MCMSDWSSDVCSSDLIDHYDVEGTRVCVVCHADILAGAIALSRHFHLQHLDTVFLWGLFVYHRYRGTATSRLLMEAAMDWYEHEPGIESVVTRFDGSNLHARQSFDRFGFAEFEIGRASCRERVGKYV